MTFDDRRFGPLPMEEMTSQQRSVAERIMSGPRNLASGLQGPFEAMLRSPGLADPAQQLGEHIRFRSAIPSRISEMAIVMVARRWTSQFEWYAHRKEALEAGLDERILEDIATERRPSLDDDATAVYDFMAELLEDGGVTDGSFDAVVSRWGKQGAMDLVGAAGYYTLVSFTLNVDRYPIPDGERPLRPRVTVHRQQEEGQR